jgi:hypothetical protein
LKPLDTEKAKWPLDVGTVVPIYGKIVGTVSYSGKPGDRYYFLIKNKVSMMPAEFIEKLVNDENVPPSRKTGSEVGGS